MINVQTYDQFYSKETPGQTFCFVPLLTRQFITQYLVELKKNNSDYKVIDIGSGADFWTKPFADATVDYYMTPQDSKKHFTVNLERESSWQVLLDYVETHGKFDFCVCSHTLEDLYYPFVAFDNIPKIAKQGIIIVPSIHREMGRSDRGQPSKGYDHHRFIYHPCSDGRFLAIPKAGHMEYKKYDIDLSGQQNELQILWNESVQYVEFSQYFEVWQGSPKIQDLPLTKRIGNISSTIFEAYCMIDPNKPVSY